MKNTYKIIALIIFYSIASSCVSPFIVKPPPSEIKETIDKNIYINIIKLAKSGDWLVTRGYKFTDHIVTTATNTPISHVGVYAKDNDTVIEAEAEGVHTSTLKEFIGKSHHVILIRPMWAKNDDTAGETAMTEARKLIGKRYDFLGTIGIDSKDRYYCSELAIYIYKNFQTKQETFPAVILPSDMQRWGDILFDSISKKKGE